MTSYSHIKSINAKLLQFGWTHYTYINQFFGDLEVREIIEQCFHKKDVRFDHYDDDAFGYHHYVINIQHGDVICSIGEGVQNTDININDNLCSTYSLLAYFGVPFSKSSHTNQLQMIAICHRILGDKHFRASVDARILTDPQERKRWENYRPRNNTNRVFYVKMDSDTFWKKIDNVLDEWSEFGHLYFIGDGKYCGDD